MIILVCLTLNTASKLLLRKNGIKLPTKESISVYLYLDTLECYHYRRREIPYEYLYDINNNYEKLDYCLQLRQLGIDTELAIQTAFNKGSIK